ncbi:lysine/ornithine N-monooxygenase [Coprinopsis cinerea okayama7|uniref:L-ornithine N(5)-monooxygenase n=1 Tax=Coprinopsis cinerea (strain Okayama-7 / 130 / ATCC MYA-4618 / FGSC 9003) TaxID=240176 RepID=CPF2_COPC7|nr:lysine/ornithine N-monooxygenase [Coprinopsis cinerea okayama7\|eukprot:XP_001833232.1 lysine/ornithine N-monooxygenase [Coprinopsis cinerea okayama7\
MSADDVVYDLVGLGFGPANIAIGAALTEKWQQDPTFSIKNTLFIEKHEVFRWHPGMLLPDAKMQISFLKDLATLRTPNSPYTFLSYLHSEDRLLSFINRGSTVPSRKEYSDYLAWAAQKVQDNGVKVKFGHEIIALDDGPDGTIEVRYRNVRTQEETLIRARDLIIAPGGTPCIPDFLQPFVNHPRVSHSSSYALKIGDMFDSLNHLSRPLRVAIIGSGQSAAEVTIDVRNRLASIPSTGRHEVDMLIRKGSLKPSDDSPFANEIFDPASTDAWFSTGSKHLRDAILAEYKQTNYSVVNPRTLEALYEIIYGQRLNAAVSRRTNVEEPSDPVINIKPYTSVLSIQTVGSQGERVRGELLLSPEGASASKDEGFVMVTKHMMTGAESQTNYDVILYATGYQRTAWVELFKNTGIAKHFGITPSTSKVVLRPSADLVGGRQHQEFFHDSSPSTASSSTVSTPPTSPETSRFSSPISSRIVSQDLYLSRSYQLLPKDGENTLRPRVYLQGVEEATHGLSDTLLSVLGVRAGEVVADLASRYHSSA